MPLPDNVRRYYIPSTQHGGGRGGFSTAPAGAAACPGIGWGRRAARQSGAAHRDGECAAGAFPQLGDEGRRAAAEPLSDARRPATLVDATAEAMGFPAIPGLPAHAPTGLINPGARLRLRAAASTTIDGSGVATIVPPRIKRVITLKVPRVDADGNELGGVPVVLRDAPLGTYLGWNITAAGFHKGKDLQLRRRHDSVRQDQGGARWPTTTRAPRSRSATATTPAMSPP